MKHHQCFIQQLNQVSIIFYKLYENIQNLRILNDRLTALIFWLQQFISSTTSQEYISIFQLVLCLRCRLVMKEKSKQKSLIIGLMINHYIQSQINYLRTPEATNFNIIELIFKHRHILSFLSLLIKVQKKNAFSKAIITSDKIKS
ncbi:unnamed protein product [Paramecium octaurelia]|uniref:Uncharacterized protein n=1 Tax=Paramecium octaurelia TaxID=43137 RepID=A0A8S1XGJ7_PAROT|nr:unnamed protein product [Paramecium octaurelia]